MTRSLFLAAAAVFLLGAAPAQKAAVDPSLAGPAPTRLTGYLSAGDINGQTVIGPPPALDSPRGMADRTIYLENRKLADTPRWKQATKDNDLWNGGALERYACALGTPINSQALPKTYHLLQRIELDARTVGTPPKDHYNRTRPLIGDERPVCIKREDWLKTNASYPSGTGLVSGALARPQWPISRPSDLRSMASRPSPVSARLAVKRSTRSWACWRVNGPPSHWPTSGWTMMSA